MIYIIFIFIYIIYIFLYHAFIIAFVRSICRLILEFRWNSSQESNNARVWKKNYRNNNTPRIIRVIKSQMVRYRVCYNNIIYLYIIIQYGCDEIERAFVWSRVKVILTMAMLQQRSFGYKYLIYLLAITYRF